MRRLPVNPLLFLGLAVLLAALGRSEALAKAVRVVDIPYLGGIKIDGDPKDWGDRGFRVEVMEMAYYVPWNVSTTDFDPTFRVGWTKEGLLVLAQVADNSVTKPDDFRLLRPYGPEWGYTRDRVSMWVGTDKEPLDCYCTQIGAGSAPYPAKPATATWVDHRQKPEPRPALTIDAAVRPTPKGYVVEAFLPWRNLGFSPKAGNRIGFQIGISDHDHDSKTTYEDGALAYWNPNSIPNWGIGMSCLRLSAVPSDPILAVASIQYDESMRPTITARVVPELNGRPVVLKHGKRPIGTATVAKNQEGWGAAQFRLASLPVKEAYPELTLSARGTILARTVARRGFEVGRTYVYQKRLPKGYAANRTKRYPLLVFLHGRGSLIDPDLGATVGLWQFLSAHPKHECILVAPQSDPPTRPWESSKVDVLIEDLLKKCRIDPDRIYLTGVSMGGYGTWYTACAHPERFAAVVPICGGGDPLLAARMKRVAAWVFHGAKDGVVPISESQSMVDALRAAGGNVRFTIYPDTGHDAYLQAFADPNLYRWLFAQKRAAE